MNWTGRLMAKAGGVCVIVLLAATSVNGQGTSEVEAREHATGRQSWPVSPAPSGTVAIPAIATRALSEGASLLLVCTSAGVRPQSYPVLSRTCREGADYCTLFVAIPETDDIRIREYDVGKPPVAVSSDETCTQPHHPPTGVLPRTMPLG